MIRRITSTRQATRARGKAWPATAQGKRFQELIDLTYRVMAYRTTPEELEQRIAYLDALRGNRKDIS